MDESEEELEFDIIDDDGVIEWDLADLTPEETADEQHRFDERYGWFEKFKIRGGGGIKNRLQRLFTDAAEPYNKLIDDPDWQEPKTRYFGTPHGYVARETGTAKEERDKRLAHVTKLEGEIRAIPQTPVVREAMKQETYREVLEYVGIDPVAFVADVGVSSLPEMLESVILAAITRGVGGGTAAIGVAGGVGSAVTAHSADVMGAMREAGVDFSDPESIIKAMDDPEFMDKIRSDATKYAAGVGLLDAFSMGVASKSLVGRRLLEKTSGGFRGRLGSGLAEVAAQGVAQGAAGGLGEVAGAALAGRPQNPGDVVGEVGGGFMGGPFETAAVGFRSARDRNKPVYSPSDPAAEPVDPDVPEGSVSIDDFELVPEGAVDAEGPAGAPPAGPINTDDLSLAPAGAPIPSAPQAAPQATPADVEGIDPDSLELLPAGQTRATRGTAGLALETPEQEAARLSGEKAEPPPLPSSFEVESAVTHTEQAQEFERLAHAQASPAVKAELFRQAEIARGKAANKPVKLTRAEREKEKRTPNPAVDDLITAIRRLGGIDTELETDFAGRLKHLHGRHEGGLGNIERPGKGRSLDDLASTLLGHGYITRHDAGELADLLSKAESGELVYSTEVDPDLLAKQAGLFDERTAADWRDELRAARTELIESGMEADQVDMYIKTFRAEGMTDEQIIDEFQPILDEQRHADPAPATPPKEESSNESTGQNDRTKQPLRKGQDAHGGQQKDSAAASGPAGVSNPKRGKPDGHQQEVEPASESADPTEPDVGKQAPDQPKKRTLRHRPKLNLVGKKAQGPDDPAPAPKKTLKAAPAPESEPKKTLKTAPKSKKKTKTLAVAPKTPLETEAAKADPDPTPKQAEQGNYKKGHVRLLGLNVAIETAKGEQRKKHDKAGKLLWSNTMGAHYGHLLGTVGADMDPVDVFIGSEDESKPVYIMNQKKVKGGGFDEHKLFVGFDNQAQARKAYMDSYPKGWKAQGRLNRVTAQEAKDWLNHGDTAQPWTREAQEKASAPDTGVDNEEGSPVFVPTQEQAHNNIDRAVELSLRSLRRIGGTLLGNRIARGFKDLGHIKLVGQIARNAEELAVLAQVYRNPSFETFRVFITNKNGKIVSQFGITSYLPAAVSFNVEVLAYEIERRMNHAGEGAGFWLLHNHPTGDPTPSGADKSSTAKISKRLPTKMRGHVIVNNTEFGTVSPGGRSARVLPLPDDVKPQYITGEDPTLAHKSMKPFVNPAELAAIAKELEKPGHFQILGRSGAIVSGIATLPVEVLNEQTPLRLQVMVNQFLRHTGSNSAVVVNVPPEYISKQRSVLKSAVKNGVLLEVMGKDGQSLRTLGVAPIRHLDGGREFAKQIHVEETVGEYIPGLSDPEKTILERFKTQPIDTAIRVPFQIADKVMTATGMDVATKKALSAAIEGTSNSIEQHMPWMVPAIEGTKAMVIDRYGLSKEYIKTEYKSQNKKRQILHEMLSLIKDIEETGINNVRANAAFHAMLTKEGPDVAEWAGLSEKIRNKITDLGQQAVDLGLLSEEVFEKNKASYLHRVYMKYESDRAGMDKLVASWMSPRRNRFKADEFKGRGLFAKVTHSRLMKDLPGGLFEGESPTVGDNIRIVDLIKDEEIDPSKKTTHVKRYYLQPDQGVPEKKGYTAIDRGVYEVRGMRGKSLTLWRDFTKAERVKMQEITDSRYTIARTMQLLAHDISTGEFYRDIAKNAAWTWQEEGIPPNSEDAANISKAQYRPLTGYDWIRVPEGLIKGTRVKRWRALSGKYIRAEIYRDLLSVEEYSKPGVWKSVMSQWKLNKTARNPVTHMNNVMSNIILMDLADITGVHLAKALRSMIDKDADYIDARDHGTFGSSFIDMEIKNSVYQRVLTELDGELNGAGWLETNLPRQVRLISRLIDKLWNGTTIKSGKLKGRKLGVKAFDQRMIELYQMEDEVFRLAAFIKLREDGLDNGDAAIQARDQFLNYDIRAPLINVLRRTMLPFLAYTYRAVPVIAKSLAQHPWKLAKYYLLAEGFQAMAYALTDGDEEEERRTFRKQEQGRTWIQIPRMVRMPHKNSDGVPTYLDVRRWIPAGDVFDVDQGHAVMDFVPAPMQFSGPVALAFEMLVFGRSAFTGQPITDELADDTRTKIEKSAAYLWTSWMPSSPLVPGSWYQQKINLASKGARDGLGRQYSLPQALLSSIGVKVVPQDVDFNLIQRGFEFDTSRRAIEYSLKSLEKDYASDRIEQGYYDMMRARYLARLDELAKNAEAVFGG